MLEAKPWKVTVEHQLVPVEYNEEGITRTATRRVAIPHIVEDTDASELDLPFRNQGVALTFGNRKGGAGKTTTSMMVAYNCAKMGIKTLYVDLDSQANATKTMGLTHDAYYPDEPFQVKTSLMQAIRDNELGEAVQFVLPNLDVVTNYIDFDDFAHWLYRTYTQDVWEDIDSVFTRLFEPIRNQYDLIIFDTPPASKEIQRNVLKFSDFVVIALQTHERSMTGAEDYINQIQNIKDMHDLPLLILGILPIMFEEASVDRIITDTAQEMYGDTIIFENIIRKYQRVKGFDLSGIVELDHHDARTVQEYESVTHEIIEKITNVW